MRKPRFVIPALFAASCALPASALAQCSPFRDARWTGDDSSASVFDLTTSKENSLVDAFGIERYDEELIGDGMNFHDEPGGLSTDDRNGSYRRLLNALLLLGGLNRGSQTYQSWAADQICTLEPTSECGINGETTPGLGGACHVNLSRQSLRYNNVLVRASTVVHEARHHDVSHRCNSDCYGVCEAGASCDTSWTQGDTGSLYGAQREQLELITAASARTDWFTPMVLAEARNLANSKLNRSFKYHPGFNLSAPSSASGFVRRTWDYDNGGQGGLQVAYMPDPDEPTYAITGLGLRMASDDNQGSALTTMEVRRRQVRDDGTLGPEQTIRVGREYNHGLELHNGVALTVPSGYVATGFIVHANRPEGADANVASLGLRARRMSANGLEGDEVTVWASGGGTVTTEANATAPSGSFLTGIGLGSQNANLTRWAYTRSSGGYWTRYVGGSGGNPYRLRCPSGQVAIGTALNTSSSGATVGYFGLVCAPLTTVKSDLTPADASMNVAHGAFDRGSTLLQARVESFSSYLATRPAGTVHFLCPRGSALAGLNVHAGDLLDRVDSLTCRSVVEASSTGTSTRSVGVGGSGGSSATSSCGWTRVVSQLYVRSGALTDGLAMDCTDPFGP